MVVSERQVPVYKGGKWVEHQGFFGLCNRLVMLAKQGEESCIPHMSQRRVRIQVNSASELFFGTIPIPIIFLFDSAQCCVRLGKRLIKL